ncbi:MAG TPA: transcriptional regulator [Gammaproteobacteria bacterium]|nr:transcriptional regulator [Gammaproteobacteria bacterium]
MRSRQVEWTNAAAAACVRPAATRRVWQQWEAGDRRMHPAMWELFQIKIKRPPSIHRP